MAITPVPPMTDTPPFPTLADRAAGTYNSKAYAFGAHMADTFNDELVAVAANVHGNATEAASAAGTATAKRNEASDFRDQAGTFAGAASNAADAAALSAIAASSMATLNGTSTTARTPSLAALTFDYVDATGKMPIAGIRMRASSRSAPTTNYAVGVVTGYAAPTITVLVDKIGDVPVLASDWNLAFGEGAIGAAGADGAAGVLQMPRKTIAGGDYIGGPSSTAPYANDLGKLIRCVGAVADFTVALDTVGNLGANWFATFSNETAYVCTLTHASIDGATSKKVYPGDVYFLQCDGADVKTQRLAGEPRFGATGTPVVAATIATPSFIAVCGLTATRGMVLRKDASSRPIVDLVDESGAVLATSAALHATGVNGTLPQIIKVNASTSLSIWGTTSGPYACLVSFAGAVLTPGAASQLDTLPVTTVGVCLNSGARATAAWGETSSNRLRAMTLGLAGVVISPFAVINADTNGAPAQMRLAAISATQSIATFFMSAYGTNLVKAKTLTDSGAGVLTAQTSVSHLAGHGQAGSVAYSECIGAVSGKALVTSGGSGGAYGKIYTAAASGTGASASVQVGRQRPCTVGDGTSAYRLAEVRAGAAYVRVTTMDGPLSLVLDALFLEGDAVTESRTTVTITSSTYAYGVAVIGANALVVYEDFANSSYPTYRPVALGTVT
jgi:hypothetical protein